MAGLNEKGRDAKEPVDSKPKHGEKRPYTRPELKEYGMLSRLTQGSLGVMGDTGTMQA